MPTVLITGANRGLGLQYVRSYAADGWRVLATCRDPGDATDLSAIIGDVQIYPLDVTEHGQIQALAKALRKETIDLLLSNAGIYGQRPSKLGGIDFDAWHDVITVNAMAPLKLCECFRSHVAASDMKKIAIMSSRMGSIGDNDSGASYVYRSSKAALNAVMKSLSVDLEPRGIAVVILHPGWVRTDMGGPSGLINASESVSGLRQVIADLSMSNTGRFYNYDGSEIPW